MLQVYDTGLQTLGTTSQVLTTDRIHGKVHKIEWFCTSATTTPTKNIQVYVDAGTTTPSGDSAIVDQYLLGLPATSVAPGATAVYYPVVPQFLGDLGTPVVTDPDQYAHHILDDVVTIKVLSGVAAETWRLKIYVDDMERK